MRAFEYANPSTKTEAVELLTAEGVQALPLAGGTDLLSLLKDDLVPATRLVNLKSIAEMRGIEQLPEGLRVGALTTLDELVAHAAVRESHACLVQAVDGVRSPQLRAMGTVGGELLQRPRCWYFRGGFGLLAARDGRSLVAEGDNRYHAIFGNQGPALFVHASSLAPGLAVLGARARIFGPEGEREEPLEKLWRVPQRESQTEVALAPGEFLTDILVPATGAASATYEVRQKQALDWPLAAAAVALQLNGGRVESGRVALGHVAPTPWPSESASRALAGKSVEEAAEAAAAAAIEGAHALSDNGYKLRLVSVATRRAVLRAAGKEVV
jgi:xanthine dehydrogenase YagS FAD-binding subunit